jgi:hypothetical protein
LRPFFVLMVRSRLRAPCSTIPRQQLRQCIQRLLQKSLQRVIASDDLERLLASADIQALMFWSYRPTIITIHLTSHPSREQRGAGQSQPIATGRYTEEH